MYFLFAARQQQIKTSSGMETSFRTTIPSLSHHGGGHGPGGHGGGHGGHGHPDGYNIAHRGINCLSYFFDKYNVEHTTPKCLTIIT